MYLESCLFIFDAAALTPIFHILFAMQERFFCQNSTGKPEEVWRSWDFGLYAKWNRKADGEELQHSLKANKSLELLCSSRPKKGRVVVGSLKILCLLLSKLSSLGCSVLQFGLHFTMLAEKKTFVHSSFLFLTPNDRKKTEFYLLPFLEKPSSIPHIIYRVFHTIFSSKLFFRSLFICFDCFPA